jgi:DNA-binding transcriptional LysR family regulator
MLELRQLHYFVVVVEEGQMTSAASRLHIAQPALSQAIAKLETDLGVKLFDRHSRGVIPTEAGAAFFERASRALVAVEEAEESVEPWLRAGPRMVIGFHEAAGDLARALLRRFMAAYPEVDIEARHLKPGERLVELKRGRIDAELIYPPTSDDQLVETLVGRSPRYVLVGETHHLAGERSLTFDQIEHEMLPGRHPTVDHRLAEETWLMGYRTAPPRLSSEAPVSLDELWALVSRGKVVAIMPQFMIPRLQGDGVRAIPLVGVDPMLVVLACLRGDTRPVIRDLRSSLDRLVVEVVGDAVPGSSRPAGADGPSQNGTRSPAPARSVQARQAGSPSRARAR